MGILSAATTSGNEAAKVGYKEKTATIPKTGQPPARLPASITITQVTIANHTPTGGAAYSQASRTIRSA